MSKVEDTILVLILGFATVCLAAATAVVVVTGWREITTPPRAVYELETGEYLHCTPEGGNQLSCEVTHRENNQ